MATVRIILRTSKKNSAGEAPLCIRIIKNRVAKFIFLDYRIRPEFWDEKERRVKKSHPNSGRINNYILQKLSEANNAALELETESKFVTPVSIKETVKGKTSIEFFPYADRYAFSFQASGKVGSNRRAKSVIEKLREYVKGRKITFDQITVSFLKDYEYYLLSTLENKINTVHANFRMIRTIFNNAVREDLVPIEINPFSKMKLKTEKTQREFLTEEELDILDSFSLEKSFMINHHRNAFIFSAYSGGLRISDVLLLRWKNFDGERITIKIHKTQTPLSIKLPERALEIINFYKKEGNTANDFIFPLLKLSPDEKSPAAIHDAISRATAYHNKDLKTLAELAGIDKHLSSHIARHTYATRLISFDVPIELISKSMGHANLRETQIYAKIMTPQLDKVADVFNRKAAEGVMRIA